MTTWLLVWRSVANSASSDSARKNLPPTANRPTAASAPAPQLHDVCYFGVRYWTNESFVNAPRLALCTFDTYAAKHKLSFQPTFRH
jgi:hypothetical protein